ncbi:MAG: hypothetical protein DRP29_07140 [Thermodesulfobacteriota bacterium]|nr:MAG: hypothetical protein DRP29_07140 [Thermodesulfobacteriota bacterium]
MREFGIDIDKITERDIQNEPSGIYYNKLQKQIRKIFYSMTPSQFKYLAQKYGINYLVMNKKYHKQRFNDLIISYENKYYLVYKLSK